MQALGECVFGVICAELSKIKGLWYNGKAKKMELRKKPKNVPV